MTLYEQWVEMAKSAAESGQQEAFWQEYYAMEQKNYENILENRKKSMEGSLSDLATTFNMESVVFTGFLDGINTSLKKKLNIEKLKENSPLKLEVDFEKLYFNMLDAKADWLYQLPQWDAILTKAQRLEITKQYRASKMAVSEKTAGRNDPCPCGSGKKYKKCCG